LSQHTRTFTHLLHLTAHAWRLAVDRHLKDSGLSMSSWMAIGLIASEPERMTQTELAQLLGLEDASMVPLVDRLVKQSLLTRAATGRSPQAPPGVDRKRQRGVCPRKNRGRCAAHGDAG